MRRREFIATIGGTAGSLVMPRLAALAQRADRVRRVGALIGGSENDPEIRTLIGAFRDEMARLGWVEGRNLWLDLRFVGADIGLMRSHAAELVSLKPDVILTLGAASTRVTQQQTQIVPIVFGPAGDVFESGIVKNVAHPEGNTTGVTNRYASIVGKLVELLKEAVPPLQRIGPIYQPIDQ